MKGDLGLCLKGAVMKDINIGLVGVGTVGGGVVKMLNSNAGFLRNNLGLPINLKRIADKATHRFSELPVGNALCSGSSEDIINDEDIQVVIELVGGTNFAKDLIYAALAKRQARHNGEQGAYCRIWALYFRIGREKRTFGEL